MTIKLQKYYKTILLLKISMNNNIKIIFITEDGEKEVLASKNDTLLEVARFGEIDLEGACEGSLACSTCHLIIEDPNLYNSLPPIADEENDLLDLAFGLTATSRLGCQVKITETMHNMKVRLPNATRNISY